MVQSMIERVLKRTYCRSHVSTEVLSRVDPRYRDSQLPDLNGPLARVVPSSAIMLA